MISSIGFGSWPGGVSGSLSFGLSIYGEDEVIDFSEGITKKRLVGSH